MKQVAITGEKQAVLVDKPDLEPFENWVVVKVHAAPMCTEYKRFLSGEPTEMLGHEAAGEVVTVAQPGRIKVGDRVVAMPLYGCGVCPLITASDIVVVHVNDAPAGIPRDELADTVRCLPLETGVIDLAGFMRKLAELGYDGPVTTEPFNQRLNALAAEDPYAAARTVSQAMDQLWQTSGLTAD